MAKAESTLPGFADESQQIGDVGMYGRTWKRVLDVAVSVPALAFTILPMLLIALVIRLDSPGNPFFLQERVGLHGRRFVMWKFRSMASRHSNTLELIPDHDGVLRHKVRNDPRVTRVGRFLRKTSLDELPQLVNVVMGQMSFVGPRPELPELVAEYEPWQHRRHAMRPGITGWWQISGRSDLPMHEHTELDIYYVDRVSVRLDIQILWRTVVGVIRGIGAF